MAASKNQQSTPHVTHRNVPPELYPSPLTESNRLGKTSVALEPFLDDEANPPSILTPHRKHDSQGTIETTQSSSFNRFANILKISLFDIPDGFRQAARSHREEAYVRTKITPLSFRGRPIQVYRDAPTRIPLPMAVLFFRMMELYFLGNVGS